MSFSTTQGKKLPSHSPVGGGEMFCSESIFTVEILENSRIKT